MNQQQEMIRKFHAVLPAVREWIDRLLEEYKPQAVTVNSLGFHRLPQHFPPDFLDRAKAITVLKVPFPPLSQFGLKELSYMEHMPLDGVTYKDTIFVQKSHRSESLHFHELVHVVKWERLGVDNFLLAYGFGLVQFGYKQSLLEQIAYTLQQDFERDAVPPNVIDVIHQRTDVIWRQVTPLIQEHG